MVSKAVDGSAEVDLPDPEGPRRDDDLTFSHGKIDVIQNVVGAVVLVDVGDFDEVSALRGAACADILNPFT